MKKKLLLLFILTFIGLELFPQNLHQARIVSLEKNPETLERLRGLSLDYLLEWENKIYIQALPGDLERLNERGIRYTIETEKFFSSSTKNLTAQTGINGEYHSYPELERDLFALEKSAPKICRVVAVGQSLEQRNIYALKISDNVQLEEEEAEIIFLGCHHAREWISVEVPYLIAKYLLDQYQTNNDVKRIVDESEIWIIPLVNPDGLEYTIHFYRYWRKNRRDNGDGNYGVDLNRNYGYKWGYDNIGSSPNTYSQVYRGKSSFSEPEIQAIRDLFAQNRFQALVSYHSFTQVILYPWGYTQDSAEKKALLDELAAEMSRLMQEVNGRLYEFGPAATSLYLTNGDTTDWAYGQYGIPAFTVELPPLDEIQGGFFNAEEDLIPIFKENLPAALFLIDWAIKNFQAKKDNRERQPQPYPSPLLTKSHK